MNSKDVNTIISFIEKIEPTDRNKFTGPEFTNSVDILFAGCSITYGLALPYEATWAHMVAEELKMSHNNLSYPGGSTMQIIFNIFKYFEEYGNPKNLFCLFPSLLRYKSYSDNKIIEKGKTSRSYSEGNGPITVYGQELLYSKYLKTPVDPEYLYSEGHRVWLNLMFISMLEIYCESNNINLLWVYYNHPSPDQEMEAQNLFKNSINVHMADPQLLGQCHEELKEKFESCFDYAEDNGHQGAHPHAHFAEDFLKEYYKKYSSLKH